MESFLLLPCRQLRFSIFLLFLLFIYFIFLSFINILPCFFIFVYILLTYVSFSFINYQIITSIRVCVFICRFLKSPTHGKQNARGDGTQSAQRGLLFFYDFLRFHLVLSSLEKCKLALGYEQSIYIGCEWVSMIGFWLPEFILWSRVLAILFRIHHKVIWVYVDGDRG